jgi:hypothetical protein
MQLQAVYRRKFPTGEKDGAGNLGRPRLLNLFGRPGSMTAPIETSVS